jgi:RNA polymerase sigma-70 factor (ECF subfamily)
MEPGREAGLVLSAQQGDLESYWELMQHYQPRVYRVAFALTRDRAAAGRLTQDTLVGGWENLSELPVGRPLLPWLLRAMRRPLTAARCPDPGATLDAAESARARSLGAAFADLDADEQLVLALGVLDKLTFETIGLVIGVPARTVPSRLAAAREHLHARFIAHANAHG